jgi:ABC-type microcin C transport system duplicated ATPase subunit YejF
MRRWYLAIPAALLLTMVPVVRNRVHAATPTVAASATSTAEKHPRIHAAIRELEAAKDELQKAPHDFGGHRADAVVAVDRAIEQLRLALQYDKK